MVDGREVKTVDSWPGLQDALAAHPLDVEDMDLNMTELASVMGVSLPTVKAWMQRADDPMPYVEAGGNGREYVLRLSWCYAWQQKQEAARLSRDAQIFKLQARLGGLEVDDDEATLSPREIREVAEARIQHAKAAQMLGTLTEMHGVYQLLEAVLVIIRNSAIGAGDRLERELSLTPAQTRAVDRVMEEMLTSAGDAIQSSVIGADYTPSLDMTRQLVNET